MASTIRAHVQRHHFDEWRTTVSKERLKDWENIGQSQNATVDSSSRHQPHELFTMEGFFQQLTWWIIVDDQVINQCFKSVHNTDSFAISLLIAIGKGREVPELCRQGVDGSHFARMVARVCAHVGTLLWAKTHMGCLLRQYRWPLATRFRAKKEVVWRIFGEKGRCVA